MDGHDETMPSRRRVLSWCGLAVTGPLAGCSLSRTEPKPVNALLQSDDTEERQLGVTVTDESGETVFQTVETVPPDDGEDLGEVRIEDAFTGSPGDQFTIEAEFEGEAVGPWDYAVSCPDDNRFSLLVEHRPADSGESPVDYVARRCNR